jgi:hypothetical protein
MLFANPALHGPERLVQWSQTNMRSKPSMALIANRLGKNVILPSLSSAYALGGPSLARIPIGVQSEFERQLDQTVAALPARA